MRIALRYTTQVKTMRRLENKSSDITLVLNIYCILKKEISYLSTFLLGVFQLTVLVFWLIDSALTILVFSSSRQLLSVIKLINPLYTTCSATNSRET